MSNGNYPTSRMFLGRFDCNDFSRDKKVKPLTLISSFRLSTRSVIDSFLEYAVYDEMDIVSPKFDEKTQMPPTTTDSLQCSIGTRTIFSVLEYLQL
ncbi:hypothetical protein TNCV_449631 [Trichonephila clavipes]|nr:hypothetical protein TNCV_449631 [Trichonephila clavipes]